MDSATVLFFIGIVLGIIGAVFFIFPSIKHTEVTPSQYLDIANELFTRIDKLYAELLQRFPLPEEVSEKDNAQQGESDIT